MFPQHPPSPRPGLIVPDSLRVVGDNPMFSQYPPSPRLGLIAPDPPLPQKSRGSRYGLNAEDLRRMNATQVPTTPLGNRSKRIITTRPQTIVPNAQQGQTQVPTPAVPVETAQQEQTQVPQPTPLPPLIPVIPIPPVEEVQEEEKYDVIKIPPKRLSDMMERARAEGSGGPPRSYEEYRNLLLKFKLHEYIGSGDDEDDGECYYFYYRYLILSNYMPTDIQYEDKIINVSLPSSFIEELDDINVIISLSHFNKKFDAYTEPLIPTRDYLIGLMILIWLNYHIWDTNIAVRIGYDKLLAHFVKGKNSPLRDFFLDLIKRKYDVHYSKIKEDLQSIEERFKKVKGLNGSKKYIYFFNMVTHNSLLSLLKKYEVDSDEQ